MHSVFRIQSVPLNKETDLHKTNQIKSTITCIKLLNNQSSKRTREAEYSNGLHEPSCAAFIKLVYRFVELSAVKRYIDPY